MRLTAYSADKEACLHLSPALILCHISHAGDVVFQAVEQQLDLSVVFRLGLEESFADLMARLPQLHAQRVAAEAAAYEEQAATLRAVYEAECSMVSKLNDDIQRY